MTFARLCAVLCGHFGCRRIAGLALGWSDDPVCHLERDVEGETVSYAVILADDAEVTTGVLESICRRFYIDPDEVRRREAAPLS